MNKSTFLKIYSNKNDWWLNTKADIIEILIMKIFKSKKISILDVASGTGFIANRLRFIGYKNITVTDRSKAALKLLEKDFRNVYYINLPSELNTNKKYDCVLLLDVIEHIRDDYSTLEAIKKLLKPDGVIIITVPAFEFLWSKKDIRVKHMRRYSLNTLKRVIKSAHLEVEYITYYNFFLFLPAVLYSLLNKKNENISRYQSRLNPVLKNIFQLEIPFLTRFLKFPFGVSLLAIVKMR